MTFAVNRKQMNRGCSNGSNSWIFEDFMFSDSVFGEVTVEYEANFLRPCKADDELFGAGLNIGEMEICFVKVTRVVVFNDDGDVIAKHQNIDKGDLNVETMQAIEDAFASDLSSIEEHERSLL